MVFVKDLAKNGLSQKALLIFNFTIEVQNEMDYTEFA